MADPVLIEPTLTLAGQAAAFNADNTGLELKITHASFGRAHYNPTGEEVALVDPVGSKVALAGGSRPTPYQLRMSLAWKEDVGEVPVGEIGFWSNETLVFIWSKADGTIASYKTDGVTYVLFNDLTFAQVPAGSINVDVDPNESVALAALAAHEGTPNAHPQYLLRADAAKDLGALTWCGLAGGTPDAIVLNLEAAESVVAGYAANQRFSFMAVSSNQGQATANVEGLGVVSIRKPSTTGLIQLDAGDMRPGVIYDLIHNGTLFQLGGGTVGSVESSGGGRAGGDFAKDDGVANAYHGTYSPAVTALDDGIELVFLAKNANTEGTGASTFSPNGVLPKPIVDQRYAALTLGKIGVGSLCTVRYIAGLDAWVLTGVTGSVVPSTLAGYGITDAYTKAQMDALVASQARVVGAVTVTGSSSVTAGTVVTLTAAAASLLSGGSIVSFTWTLPDGTSAVTPATSNSATRSITALGSIGTNYTVKVMATDNAGNTSQLATKYVAITNHAAPTAPTTVDVSATVFQNSTGNTLSATGAAASDGATVSYSLSQSGTVAVSFNKTTGIAAGEQVTFSAPAVAVDTPVTISVFAVDSMGGVSAVTSKLITVAAFPSTAGAIFGGGYYAGANIVINNVEYALVTAPAALGGESTNKLYWRTTNSITPGATSETDGIANWSAIIASGIANHPAAQFCASLTIGGKTDWRLPSLAELEIMYRYLKGPFPSNNINAGENLVSRPVGALYTAKNPLATTIPVFKSGGAEAFKNDYYWGSNQQGGTNPRSPFARNMQDGGLVMSTSPDNPIAYVRAVRLVRVSP